MNVSIELKARTRDLQAGDKLSTAEKIEAIQAVADELMRRNVRAIDLMEVFCVSRNTAIDWLNQAFKLLANESHFTAEGLRHVHRGQIEHNINVLVDDLKQAESLPERLQIHDRLIKYLDARARTSGLNSEVVEHKHTIKPLTINMPTPIEGEVIKEQS